VRECKLCEERICADCVVPIDDHAVCKSCLTHSLTWGEQGLHAKKPLSVKDTSKKSEALHVLRDKAEIMQKPAKHMYITLLFSALPGLGHYYLGLQKRGINLMILFFALAFLNKAMPGFLQVPFDVAIPLLWLYGQYDAFQYHMKLDEGKKVEDVPLLPQLMNSPWLGYAVIVLGILAVIYALLGAMEVNGMIRQTVQDLTAAVVLFGIGTWILMGRPMPYSMREKGDHQDHA
jgi:hypothetical protein